MKENVNILEEWESQKIKNELDKEWIQSMLLNI